MARVTVEDCIVHVPNRFDLVVLAAQRVRQLVAGAPMMVDRDNDKNPVVALREIAEEKVDLINLEDATITTYRRQIQTEASEEIYNHLVEETRNFQDQAGVPELSLTGELDEEEAALDAEFSEIEKNLETEI